MTFKRILAFSIAAAFAASGAALAQDKQQDKQQDKSAAPPKGAPMIVLVPMVVASRPDFSNGCWARLYDGSNFKGNELALVGPVDMPNMRTAFGTDWSGEFDSIQVGPKARLTVYDNENYRERAANFKPGQKVADLDEKLGFFEDISSVKVACTGGASTAQQKGSGAAGASSPKK
ncbi:MAG TPA: beta/gamma crystallin domain-containing protein [Burkholderiales bacterium]